MKTTQNRVDLTSLTHHELVSILGGYNEHTIEVSEFDLVHVQGEWVHIDTVFGEAERRLSL